MFYSTDLPPDFHNPEYVSSNGYSLRSLELIERCSGGLVLDMGAGLAVKDYPNVVQLEIRRYRGTDVVSTFERLPFRDGVFDGVISQAVIEHVRDPRLHVDEIRRVLKVGGSVVLDAAFLQPLHGAPYHYFNTTSHAIELLFSDLSLDFLEVAPYQHPWYMLRWILGSYRSGLKTDQARRDFDELTVRNLFERFEAVDRSRSAFRDLHAMDPTRLADWGENINVALADTLGCLVELSDAAEWELAAGYRVIAHKEEAPRDRDTRSGPLAEGVSSAEEAFQDTEVELQRVAQLDQNAHTGELFGDRRVCQSLRVRGAIARLDVAFATFMRRNTHDIEIVLSEHPEAPPLRRLSVNAAELADNQFHTFRFSPLVERESDNLAVTISSPTATSSDCVTVRRSNANLIEQGKLTIDGVATPGSMTIKIYVAVTMKRPVQPD